MRGFLRFCTEQGAALACVKAPEGRGNPVWFGNRYFGALSALGETLAVGRFWHNTQKKCFFIRQNRQK